MGRAFLQASTFIMRAHPPHGSMAVWHCCHLNIQRRKAGILTCVLFALPVLCLLPEPHTRAACLPVVLALRLPSPHLSHACLSSTISTWDSREKRRKKKKKEGGNRKTLFDCYVYEGKRQNPHLYHHIMCFHMPYPHTTEVHLVLPASLKEKTFALFETLTWAGISMGIQSPSLPIHLPCLVPRHAFSCLKKWEGLKLSLQNATLFGFSYLACVLLPGGEGRGCALAPLLSWLACNMPKRTPPPPSQKENSWRDSSLPPPSYELT